MGIKNSLQPISYITHHVTSYYYRYIDTKQAFNVIAVNNTFLKVLGNEKLVYDKMGVVTVKCFGDTFNVFIFCKYSLTKSQCIR